MGVLSRMKAASEAKARAVLTPDDVGFREAFPSLWELLTAVSDPDTGEDRETTTLLLFAEGDRWKVCLNNRSEGTVGFWSSSCFSRLLPELEAALTAGKVEWRESKTSGGRKK